MKYVSSIIMVSNLGKSRHFYEDILHQIVKFDFGYNITYEGDFAIQQPSYFRRMAGTNFPKNGKSNRSSRAVLYFESDEVQACERRLRRLDVQFIHGIQEQHWGQRVFRCYDPDGYIIEIGETREELVLRLAGEGLSLDEICSKSGYPESFVSPLLESDNQE